MTDNNNSGFRWSIRQSFDPRFQVAAADAPRRLREDLHQVIRGLSPLVERSQNMTLSTWLRHSRPSTEVSASSANENLSSTANSDEFVISMDDDNSSGTGRNQIENHQNANLNQVPVSGTVSGNSDNGGGTGGGEHGGNASDTLRQTPELRRLLQVAEKYLPFLLILLAKLIFDHKTGILVLAGLVVTFMHANAIITREVGKQNKRNLGSLCAVVINLVTCIVFIYFVFESDKLHYSLICLLPSREISLTFWELLWLVGITDFVLKLITVLCKAVIVLLPMQVIHFQKKGKYYLFIEQTSQLYRSFTPIHPWLCYLLEAYEGIAKLFGIILSVAYVISKAKDVLKKMKLWRNSLSKLMQSVTYGIKPSKEQLETNGSKMCPICQDDFKYPTMLQCKHMFCEECVVLWFDRERTCPMCRAEIADDPTWRDGATSFFLQLF